LLADRPGASLDARRARGSALHGLGLVLKKTGALDEAKDTLKQALAVREAIVKDPSATDDDRKALAETRFQYAALLAREGIRQSAVIQQSYGEAVSTLETLAAKQTPEAATVLARALNNYGKFLWRTGKDAKTEAFFRKAIADLQVRLKATPGSSADRWQLARLNSNLGVLLSDPSRWGGDNARQKADLAEAEAAEKNGVSDLERLTGDFPRIPDYRREQASALQNLGDLLRQRGQFREAETAFTKARDLFQALSREPSPTIDDSLGLAGSSLSLGSAILDQNGDLDRAEGFFREADAILSGLLTRLPNVAEYGLNLGSVRANHALLLLKKGLPNDALKLLGEAVELHKKALKALPDSPQVARELARDYFLQCLAFKSVGDHARLASAADDLAGVKPEDAIRHLHAAAMFAQAVPLVSANASAGEPSRRDREEVYARSAVTHLRKALTLDSKTIDPKRLDSADFAPLKGRDEFERLKSGLTGPAKPQPR
jgi:tetratricopeptide (TPR) repeat protein